MSEAQPPARAARHHAASRSATGATIPLCRLQPGRTEPVREHGGSMNTKRKRAVALKVIENGAERTVHGTEDSLVQLRGQTPFFSVVMPVYDRTAELRQAIDSVVRQSLDDWELLIVLDGSPDDTRSIVHSYRDDPRIRVFSYDQSSGNACRGRNRGIVEARGAYVAFLDSDDIALPNRLAATRAAIAATGADVVAGCALYQRSGARHLNVPDTGTRSTPVPLSLGCLFRVNPFVTSCVAVNLAALLVHGGFRPAMRYREDQELWLRLYARRHKFHFLDDLIGIYRIHDGNLEPKINDNPQYWLGAAQSEYRVQFKDWGL